MFCKRLVRVLSKFQADREGVAALEFAILAPLFLGIVFAIFEVFVMMLASMYLEDGMDAAVNEIYELRKNDKEIELASIRPKVCEAIPSVFVGTCNEDNVKIAIFYTGNLPVNKSEYTNVVQVPFDNQVEQIVDTKVGDLYLVGLSINNHFRVPGLDLIGLFSGDKDIKLVNWDNFSTMRSVSLTRVITAK